MFLRKEVERIIKEQKLDRNRVFEVPKIAYAGIIKKIEAAFVAEGGTIHWSNMGHFQSKLSCKTLEISSQPLWYHSLEEIIPMPEAPFYVLLEDRKNYQAKYWLYEMFLPELIAILDDIEGLGDFYIISKKYRWLVSENHEEIVSFLGDELESPDHR